MNRFLKYSFVLFFVIAGFYQQGYAQNIQVEATLDKPSILIGDQTQLHLSARMHVKDNVSFPVLKDSIGKEIQILSSKTDTVFDKDDVSIQTIRKNYTITSFDSGEYAIPAYDFKTPGGVLKSSALTLRVNTVAVDTTKGIYDIKQPLTVKYSFLDWLHDNWKQIVIAWLVVMALAAIMCYIIVKLRKKKPVIVQAAVKPLVPPHVTALQKLNELKGKNLWQQEQAKQYYIELSDVIREYLEQRYHITALEQTSEEIFTGIKYLDIASENRNLLRQILILSDLVKFAKEKPLPHENEKSLDNAISFVTGTQEIERVEIKEDTNK